MNPEYQKLLDKAKEREALIKRQMKYLSRFHIKNFDHIVADMHDEAFAGIDCLACGNCCRVLGPRFGDTEVTRACKAAGFRREDFIRDHLEKHEEGGWAMRTHPCPFLNEGDNACGIFEDRPRDCGDYPYTDKRNIQRSLGRLAFNSQICPAAYLVAERIMERFADGQTK